jgi:carbonic anhydrase/acetyltransferase-like protein (isoleucine patch superfamily)
MEVDMLRRSPKTSWSKKEHFPKVADTAYISETAVVTGPVKIGELVMISPGASIRGDEGGKIFIGDKTNVQDNVIMHGLKEEVVHVDGEDYSIYIADGVSCGHASIIHGPAFIGKNTFVGFHTIVHHSTVGKNCYLGHGSKIIGVTVPDGKYVPHGAIIHTTEAVEDIPNVTDKNRYFFRFNEEVVAVNVELAKGYAAQHKENQVK